eukprot:1498049-Prymnesium_polylepis.1
MQAPPAGSMREAVLVSESSSSGELRSALLRLGDYVLLHPRCVRAVIRRRPRVCVCLLAT